MARRSGKGKQDGQQAALPIDYSAGYIRVSTDKQAEEGFSLAAQEERIKAYCTAQGWILSHLYADAVSGKSTARPQFQALLEAVQAGRVKRVVAVKLDRLARNTRDFLATVDVLAGAGCALALIKESFDTSTPHGKFALTMFAAMAELEVSTIQERTMSGRVQKANQGGFNGAKILYGYDYDGETFTPNDQAPIVAGIFADFLAGKSINAIARALNADGVRTAQGRKWYASTVHYILHNGFYAGFLQYDGQEAAGLQPAIIKPPVYERAQSNG